MAARQASSGIEEIWRGTGELKMKPDADRGIACPLSRWHVVIERPPFMVPFGVAWREWRGERAANKRLCKYERARDDSSLSAARPPERSVATTNAAWR